MTNYFTVIRRNFRNPMACILTALMTCLSILGCTAGSAASSEDKIIASVNDRKITQNDLESCFLTIKPKQGTLTQEVIPKIKQIALTKLIFKEFYDALLKQERSEISEKDVDKELDRMISNLPKNRMDEIEHIISAVSVALEAWHANPNDEKKIYDAHLSKIISFSDWRAYRDAYHKLNSVDKKKGYMGYLKAWSRKGIVKQLAWQRLKQRITADIDVESSEVREQFERNYPRVVFWDVWHFFHHDEKKIKEVSKFLEQSNDNNKVISEFRLLNPEVGGVVKERLFRRPYYPFYAERIEKLNDGQVGPITFGFFYPISSTGEHNAVSSQKENQYYHVLFVARIKYSDDDLSFDDVKGDIEKELLESKKEAYWHDWLVEQFNKAEIKVMDDRFKVPEFLDQYEEIPSLAVMDNNCNHNVFLNADSQDNGTTGKKPDIFSLPPTKAVNEGNKNRKKQE